MNHQPTPDDAQQWDAGLYQSRHSFVWKFGADLLELLAVQPGEKVLDIGCGTGQLTQQIAAQGAIVTGFDNAPAMVRQARHNFPDVRFEVADASAFDFGSGFDAVFSNATLHWVRAADGVARCIAHALRPGGRFVAEFGGHGNVQRIQTALHAALKRRSRDTAELDMWHFPGIAEYATLLERHSLEVTYAVLFDRPTPLEGGDEGLRIWLRMFANHFLRAVPEDQRDEFLAEVEAELCGALHRDGAWAADYRRLRVVAHKVVKNPAAILLS